MDHILRQARRLPPERPWLRRAAPGLAIAACLVLAVGMGYHRWRLAEEVAPIMYATTTGEQRSEEHTSELQSLMRISYAVFCLKKKKKNKTREVIPGVNRNKTEQHK